MVKLNGFSDYSLKIETGEIISVKDGEETVLKEIGDSRVKSWHLYQNGYRVRKSIWAIYLENWKAIESYCLLKGGVSVNLSYNEH